jgi:KipI family sensor histidine kinase inhibitor
VILRSYGRSALLAEVADPAAAVALRAAIEARRPVGVIETMPGLQTVLVRFDPGRTDPGHLARVLRALPVDAAEVPAGSPEPPDARVVRVDYSGPDLPEVAERCRLSVDDVIGRHVSREYRVVLIGMAPGFYYLSGGDPRLRVARRATPRTDVPKGALGLADDYTGIYPRTGPGGWQLIGSVRDELWHPDDLPAARLAPGARVRFEAA